jgi:H+/Cl- antiporter ClcA
MGEIIGSIIAAYLVCKLLELILKRVIRNYRLMVVLSAATVGVLLALAFRYKVQALGTYDAHDQSLLGSQVIAVVLLPIIRMTWRSIRSKRDVQTNQTAAREGIGRASLDGH